MGSYHQDIIISFWIAICMPLVVSVLMYVNYQHAIQVFPMRANFTKQLGLKLELNSLGFPIRDDKKSQILKKASEVLDKTPGVID